MYLKRSIYHFLQLLSLVLYPIINEIVYSCHFHNFDLLSVLSFCVFFVQSFVVTPKRPLSFTCYFARFIPCVVMFYEPHPCTVFTCTWAVIVNNCSSRNYTAGYDWRYLLHSSENRATQWLELCRWPANVVFKTFPCRLHRSGLSHAQTNTCGECHS